MVLRLIHFRVAALKCRQRKKQWLQNLQAKVDLYSQENDALTHTVNNLREHILQLRQILMQHKDCPVAIQQGINPQNFMAFLNQENPYIQQGQPMSIMMQDNRQGNGNPVLPRS